MHYDTENIFVNIGTLDSTYVFQDTVDCRKVGYLDLYLLFCFLFIFSIFLPSLEKFFYFILIRLVFLNILNFSNYFSVDI
jgi:hypothetical protein